MKNFKLLLSAIILIVFSSCSKDENPEPEDPNAIKFRVQEVKDPQFNSSISKFTYNSENLVTKSEAGNTLVEYRYTNGILDQEVYSDKSTLAIIETVNYTINNNEVISKQTKIFATNKIFGENYINNAAKRPISKRFFDYNNTTQAWISDITKDEDYQYDAQNRIIVKNTYNNHYEYGYDANSNLIEQKKFNGGGTIENPYLLVEKIETTFNNIKPLYYLNSSLSKNSPLTEKTSIYDDGVFQSVSEVIYRYDFNGSNYITKSYKNGIPEFDFVLERI